MAEVDDTYVNAKFLRQRAKVCAKCAADVQQAGQSTRSKVNSERVVLLVLIAILVATIIALAVKINPRTSFTPTCPPPPEGKNETCLKCGAGWELHGGNCYKINSNKSSWTESRRSCKDLGGDLVKIDSREEQMFLEITVRDFMEEAEDKFWIGLTDSDKEGRWLWVDGSPLDERLKFWFKNEPDDWKGHNGQNPAGEDCVRMGKKGGTNDLKCWFDRSCEDPHKSICEKMAESGQRSCVCV